MKTTLPHSSTPTSLISRPCLPCLLSTSVLPVAPQLTVVSAPSCHQALERLRGTPSRRGWRPTRRWHRQRQPCPDRPAMRGAPRGQRRYLLAPCHAPTLVRRAPVRDRAHPAPALGHRQGGAGQPPAPPAPRRPA